MAPTVVWFRRDLRVVDLATLRDAAERGPVVCLWIADPDLLGRRHHQAPARLAFLREGLAALDLALRERGVPLVVRHGAPADVLVDVARECGADRVVWTAEVSPRGRARDAGVAAALERHSITSQEYPFDLHAQPHQLTASSGNGYMVFTPFWRAWSQIAVDRHHDAPGRLTGPVLKGVALNILGTAASPLPAGPDAARQAVVAFIKSGDADRYHERRDLLEAEGTSRLSAYLRFGMVGAGQVGRALGLPGELSSGRQAFWRQICWREFYAHHLLRHPHVARRALRADLAGVVWDNDPEHVEAWRQGLTGYPLVDAALRQLAREGFIHNRARMVAASFLVKDLLVDWRVGERIFMQGLVDGDPANNNGGWQWVAGTGTDAAPYFRVLNPVLQAKRFDPSGAYVRRYVPELDSVPHSRIFEPWRMSDDQQAAAGCVIGRDYPAPIVDHALARRAILARYEAARSSTG